MNNSFEAVTSLCAQFGAKLYERSSFPPKTADSPRWSISARKMRRFRWRRFRFRRRASALPAANARLFLR